MARLKIARAEREMEMTVPKFITPDGAWCWFADPRAVYYEGKYSINIETFKPMFTTPFLPNVIT